MSRRTAEASLAPSSLWTRLTRHLETRLLLTLLAVAAALLGFVKLTGEVLEGETGWIDRTVLLAFRAPGQLDVAIGPRWVQEAARDISALGGFTVLTLVSIMATALLLIHARRLQAILFASTVIIAQAASAGLKLMVNRPRPDLVPHLDLVYASSFPSGHAMMTSVVYLTLAAILAAGERAQGEKVLLVSCAAVVVVTVGVSRVYLGVHWPTDVLAGWTVGSALALGAVIVLRFTAARRASIAPTGSAKHLP